LKKMQAALLPQLNDAEPVVLHAPLWMEAASIG
jgi:hypothetical protein